MLCPSSIILENCTEPDQWKSRLSLTDKANITINMKVKSFLSIAAYLLLGAYLFSCSKQGPEAENTSRLPENQNIGRITTQKDANMAIAPFISLDEEKREYSLDITKEEAMHLGLTEAMYEDVCKEVEKINHFIKEQDKEHPGELILTNPKQDSAEA